MSNKLKCMNTIFTSSRNVFFLLFVITTSVYFSQVNYCKLYIYSEFDNYSLYIDNKYIGDNVKEKDSIECNEHYIKITYQDVIVFSEIIKFNENEIKKILIKKTKEVEEKLLSSKTKEVSEYRRRKISLGIEKKYITTTNVNLDQYTFKPLFGNYYGLNYSGKISGIQFSESEEKITDWFFTESGITKLTDIEFFEKYCKLTKKCGLYQFEMKRLEEHFKKIDKINKKRTFWMNFFAILSLIGGISLFWGIIEYIIPIFLTSGSADNLVFFGIIALVIGVLGILPIKIEPYSSPPRLISLKEALKMIDEYNAALKKELNLPENAE